MKILFFLIFYLCMGNHAFLNSEILNWEDNDEIDLENLSSNNQKRDYLVSQDEWCAIWIKDADFKVTDEYKGNLKQKVNNNIWISGAGNEVKSIQLIFESLKNKMIKNVMLEFSDLESICTSAGNILHKIEKDTITYKPELFNIPAADFKSILLFIHIPKTAISGDYSGYIWIEDKEGIDFQINLFLQVVEKGTIESDIWE